MTKWDSHTHSIFCKHGSGEETGLMIEKAIELGFTKYSISEHAPLPEALMPDPAQRSEFTLLESEVDDYFSHIDDLKRLYGDRIEILKGLEIDYLSGFEQYTFDFIKNYENDLEDLILSLHCIEGKSGLRSVDYTPADFEDGLLDYYGSINAVYHQYWETIKKMLSIDFSFSKTRRIGHIGLIHKFFSHYPSVSPEMITPDFFENIFALVKNNGWTLEFNAAGMSKGFTGNAYLTEPMLYCCKKFDIEILYGSDAHGSDMVGKYYDTYLEMLV